MLAARNVNNARSKASAASMFDRWAAETTVSEGHNAVCENPRRLVAYASQILRFVPKEFEKTMTGQPVSPVIS